jgi:hypothetical protein
LSGGRCADDESSCLPAELPLSHDGGSSIDRWLFPSREELGSSHPNSVIESVSKRTVPPTKTNVIDEPVRKSGRVIKPRERLIETCIAMTTPKVTSSIQTPLSLKEALASPKANLWLKAILKEHNALKRTLTYKLVDLPVGRKALGAKPIFKLKVKADGSPE